MSDWRKHAACRDHDPELWFPPSDAPSELVDAQVATAKAICAGCPVLHSCRSWALETGERFGVWGGMSEAERRRARRGAAAPPAVPVPA